jgi:hypothetical protein
LPFLRQSHCTRLHVHPSISWFIRSTLAPCVSVTRHSSHVNNCNSYPPECQQENLHLATYGYTH